MTKIAQIAAVGALGILGILTFGGPSAYSNDVAHVIQPRATPTPAPALRPGASQGVTPAERARVTAYDKPIYPDPIGNGIIGGVAGGIATGRTAVGVAVGVARSVGTQTAGRVVSEHVAGGSGAKPAGGNAHSGPNNTGGKSGP